MSFRRLLTPLAAAAAVALGIGLAGCHPKQAGPPAVTPAPSLRILRISQRNEPADLDPAIAALPDEFFIIRALSEGLVVPATHGGEPFPAAADRWNVSPDGLTWTFHLRPGALWSDGEPVTSADFVASYRRVLSPATAAPHPELFYPVRNARDFVEGRLGDFSQVGFSAPDPSTLVVRLAAPNPRFLDYVASGPWIPVNPRVVARYGRNWTRPGHYVGNGPYLLSVWEPDRRIVVDRNPRYYDAAGIELDEIQFLRFDDGATEERAYRTGDVDITMAIPQSRIAYYAEQRPAEFHRAPLAETRYLVFNTRRPPLDDPRVRQALALAIDRLRLTEDVLLGGQEPAYRLMPAELRPAGDVVGEVGIGEREAGDAAAARAQARRLLADAGFPDGAGFPRLELAGWSDNPVLEVIQSMWHRALGIDVGIVNREARAHVAALVAGTYDIGFITLIPNVADPEAVLQTFTSDSPDNYSHWNDNLYDGLVGAAALAPDTARRDALLAAAETRLMTLVPISPLYFNEKNWLMKPYVRGWMENEMWTRYYPGLWIDRNRS